MSCPLHCVYRSTASHSLSELANVQLRRVKNCVQTAKEAAELAFDPAATVGFTAQYAVLFSMLRRLYMWFAPLTLSPTSTKALSLLSKALATRPGYHVGRPSWGLVVGRALVGSLGSW